jgi:hypothetical protein
MNNSIRRPTQKGITSKSSTILKELGRRICGAEETALVQSRLDQVKVISRNISRAAMLLDLRIAHHKYDDLLNVCAEMR